ncbi:MAG TPA: exodeoxyribonuclease VII small subunit [Dermatophilaceae bacterium]|nr:exodeoxyribonuclease VII small subunit [Dermatophilaceae bacterium]
MSGTGEDLPVGIVALPYEQARDELAGIVARLEGGQLGLEDSMTLWERGEHLARHCSRLLDGAQARIAGATTTGATSASGVPGRGDPGSGEPVGGDQPND